MAVTIDEILTRGKGPAITAGIPSIDSSLQGAPATVPGTGSGKLAPGATDIKGHPVEKVVTVPAPIAPEIQGAPNAGQTVAKPRLEIIPPELPNANSLPKIGEKINQPETVKRVTDINSIPEKNKNEEQKKLSYVELFQQLSPYKPPTPEELERERKKQKREAIFSAIGEGISALSNLYFTSQYAPNAFDPSKGMAATTKKRFDQLKKEREANQREYMSGYMRAMQMDADAARDERNWSHTIEREKITDKWRQAAEDRAQAKADRDAKLADLQEKRLNHQITEAEYKAKVAEANAKYAEENARLKNKLKEAQIVTEGTKQTANKARANASNASANLSNAKADKISEHDFKFTNADGQAVQFDENDFDNYYDAVPQAIKEKHMTYTYSGIGLKRTKVYKAPTKEQKKAAIGEYISSMHGKNRNGKWTNASQIKY